MDISQALIIVAGIACAFAAGYIFGGSVPTWDEDYYNEGPPGGGVYGPGMGMGWGWGRDYYAGYMLGGCLRGAMKIGKIGSILLAIAALVLIYGYSGLGSNDGLGERGGSFLLLFDVRTWLLVGGAAAGYILCVLTDKGPVGPLE